MIMEEESDYLGVSVEMKRIVVNIDLKECIVFEFVIVLHSFI